MAPPLVLHILPADLTRGAQAYARQLRDALDDSTTRHRTLTLFSSHGGVLEPDLTLAVPAGLGRRAGIDPRAVWRLRHLVAREGPEIVVAHGSEPLKYAVLAGIPVNRLVCYKIGAGHARLGGSRRWLNRVLLSRAGMIAAVSAVAADEARALGVGEERLRVIPNGRDPAAYAVRSDAPRLAPLQLVWVGHLDAAKRPEVFLALVRALRAADATLRCAIAGDGPRQAEIEASSRTLGVDVLGAVRDVPTLLAESDVMVFTSTPNEGMPGVLVEAGMAGLPVVSTDVPGAREIVADGETGFVVGVDDFEALVHATRSLLADAPLRARLGAAARARCVARFNLEAGVSQWRALLADMMRNLCASST